MQMAQSMKPRIRNVQATSSFLTRRLVAMLMTADPRLPPPNTTPIAKPRYFLNHLSGAVEHAWGYLSAIANLGMEL